MRFPFASDTLLFAPPLGAAALLCLFMGWGAAGWLMVGLTLFVLYFFRDPERIAPPGDDLLVAPADGKVVQIDTAYRDADHPDGAICVSIFLSIFNVHIQRTPLAGTILRKAYNRGKFLAAWDHKASLDNEQALTVMRTAVGIVSIKQIAGLIARRIFTWVDVGAEVEKGAHLGLIRFGSRVDLIVPPSVEILSVVGDKVSAGETVMARLVKRQGSD
jgi:phosphatidylserine decarboxylase